MIRGVIFDKDGTLFDFHASWGAWAAGFLASLGGDTAALARAIAFNPDTGRFAPQSPAIAGTPAQIADALLPHLPHMTRPDLLAVMNRSAAAAQMIAAVPLADLLDGLRAHGLCLGLVTNDAEAPARAHLGRHAIIDRFDFIAGFDSGFGAKPQAGQLLAFCAATGLDPEAVVMVGDSTHDLHAGRIAGMATIGVLTGPALREELQPLADAVLDHIGQLPAWLAEKT
ncbi:HAD family hydrolase [Falsirhodobacter deserti]|uniref:HAD family hydrolase n=1 Tax=Falsirhodobacter deserti TaxID=1365611 RepID=UPI000FE3B334|nr:HAD family hydrolase [Falsirhodobacter deserti]